MTAQPASTVDVLKAAREKIAKPEAWTKEAFARDANGDSVSVHSDQAVCWCWTGSLLSVGADICGPEYSLLQPDQRLLSDVNDDPTTTHADILAMFDKAIALAEGEV